MVYSKTKFNSVYEYTVGPIISVYNNLTISETKRLQQIQPLFLAHIKHAASHRIVYDNMTNFPVANHAASEVAHGAYIQHTYDVAS